jgi:hypothetical protein
MPALKLPAYNKKASIKEKIPLKCHKSIIKENKRARREALKEFNFKMLWRKALQ